MQNTIKVTGFDTTSWPIAVTVDDECNHDTYNDVEEMHAHYDPSATVYVSVCGHCGAQL